MSIDLTKVRLLLRSVVTSIPGIPPLAQWENQNFEGPDPEGTNWIRELNSPLSERPVATNTIQHVGTYRIDVVVPSGSGTETLESLTDSIKAAFEPGDQVQDPACTVQIIKSERLPARRDTRDNAWYFQSVAVTWHVYTTFV
jgi:hypothetical protein